MATTNINVRVDTELKQSAESLFNDLGLNMSTAITMFLKSAVSYDGIPFEIKRIPNAETRQAMQDTLDGKGLSRVYSSFGEMMRDIDAGD